MERRHRQEKEYREEIESLKKEGWECKLKADPGGYYTECTRWDNYKCEFEKKIILDPLYGN